MCGADPEPFVVDASLGAPADPLNMQGQNWGLAPFSPRALRQRAYRPIYRAAARQHASRRDFAHRSRDDVAPRVLDSTRRAARLTGAYVRYPFDEMLAILALESVRNKCAVVGEDLGTVPEGFRERMESAERAIDARSLFSTRMERRTVPSARTLSTLAAVSIGTHDLPTLAGWWTGDRSTGEDRAARSLSLVDALERADAVDSDRRVAIARGRGSGGTMAVVDELSAAAYRFLGGTPSMLLVVAIGRRYWESLAA